MTLIQSNGKEKPGFYKRIAMLRRINNKKPINIKDKAIDILRKKVQHDTKRMNSYRHPSGAYPARNLKERTFMNDHNNYKKTYKA